MKSENEKPFDDFYFPLPRLLNRIRGGSDKISESNAAEAYFGSIAVLLVSFLFAWQLFAGQCAGWQAAAVGLLLLFAVSVFWLFVFYFNSLVIKILRASGVLRKMANRHAQDILIETLVAFFAYELSISDFSWTRWIGVFCLLLLGLNLTAALLLALGRAQRSTD
jgi:hypothetical protein